MTQNCIFSQKILTLFQIVFYIKKTYSKPVVTIDIDLAEDVYAASGCYTVSAYIHQKPETGRGDYRIQLNGQHWIW